MTTLSLPSTQAALDLLVSSAAVNIPGVDFASITVRHKDQSLDTVAFTDELANKADRIQYDLREGPCYSAVTDERFVLVNDLANEGPYLRYGPRAARIGIGAQAAIQLVNNHERAGLNLYAHRPAAFDRSTIQLAEMFSTHASALLGYARQVETLGGAIHSRQDIGTAIGILMERYQIDRDRAFAFLTRVSSHRNTKLRIIAGEVIDGTFRPGIDDANGTVFAKA
jgi:ANTAR domain/GAF domain